MALVDVIIGYAKGGQGDVGPQGPEGPQGPQGPQGPLPPLVNNALSTTPGVAALDAAMGKTLQDEINTTNSNLTAKSIGNAIANTGWEVIASNLTINNTIGLLYGKIKYTGTNTPAWGSIVGNFPNYHSGYNLPLLLYRTSGDLCLTASVDTGGTIFVYNPDLTKIVTGAEFHFQATYVVG